MTKSKWERLKSYIQNINDLDGNEVKEMVLNQMEYMETIDDDGTPLKL